MKSERRNEKTDLSIWEGVRVIGADSKAANVVRSAMLNADDILKRHRHTGTEELQVVPVRTKKPIFPIFASAGEWLESGVVGA